MKRLVNPFDMSGRVEDNVFSPGDVHTCPFTSGTFHGSKAQKRDFVTRGAFLAVACKSLCWQASI